jgi:putative SOS response-associated peptidase YedK
MCYDIQAKLDSMLKRAMRENNDEHVQEILRKIERFTGKPMFHLSGFDHPEILIYTDKEPTIPTIAKWGLVPNWVKDEEASRKIVAGTLNARGESIFDKPSFAESAKNQRCIICIDGFFEHQHYKGKKFPYFIANKNGKPLTLGGLWNEWQHPVTGDLLNSFSIVTTKANSLMTEIHNNPKLLEPRMPLILTEEGQSQWLAPATGEDEWEKIKSLITPSSSEFLTAHTVGRLRGKHSPGNSESITDEVIYAELSNDAPTLF